YNVRPCPPGAPTVNDPDPVSVPVVQPMSVTLTLPVPVSIPTERLKVPIVEFPAMLNVPALCEMVSSAAVVSELTSALLVMLTTTLAFARLINALSPMVGVPRVQLLPVFQSPLES